MNGSNDQDGSTKLEDQIVARLRAEGLIAPSDFEQRRGPGAPLLATILGAAIAAVILLQVWTPAHDGREYVLALYSGADHDAPQAADHLSRAREYGEWAKAHDEGAAAVIGGEELGPPVATLGQSPPPAQAKLVGFFQVKARSPEDAVALAKTTPHLRYGGSVTVRPVVR